MLAEKDGEPDPLPREVSLPGVVRLDHGPPASRVVADPDEEGAPRTRRRCEQGIETREIADREQVAARDGELPQSGLRNCERRSLHGPPELPRGMIDRQEGHGIDFKGLSKDLLGPLDDLTGSGDPIAPYERSLIRQELPHDGCLQVCDRVWVRAARGSTSRLSVVGSFVDLDREAQPARSLAKPEPVSGLLRYALDDLEMPRVDQGAHDRSGPSGGSRWRNPPRAPGKWPRASRGPESGAAGGPGAVRRNRRVSASMAPHS